MSSPSKSNCFLAARHVASLSKSSRSRAPEAAQALTSLRSFFARSVRPRMRHVRPCRART